MPIQLCFSEAGVIGFYRAATSHSRDPPHGQSMSIFPRHFKSPEGEVVAQLMASQFFLFPCSSSLLCCLCSWSCVYMVTNLVALSQLNKSLSVYRVPHSTHARQEFTMMCLRRKYIQMFMRHHPICGLF